MERAARLLAQEEARRAAQAQAEASVQQQQPAVAMGTPAGVDAAARKRVREAENATPQDDASSSSGNVPPSAQQTKQMQKKRKTKESVRDEARGLKQVGIASFFGR